MFTVALSAPSIYLLYMLHLIRTVCAKHVMKMSPADVSVDEVEGPKSDSEKRETSACLCFGMKSCKSIANCKD